MSDDDDFNRIFGARSQPPISFAERYAARPEPAPPPPAAPAPSDDGAYKAFGFLPAGTIGETCDVRRWIEGTDIPEGIEFQYRFLMQVGYVGEEQLRLMLPDCIVVIHGQCLGELRSKLARRQVTFLQQHNLRLWPGFITNEAVRIDKIEIVRAPASR